MISLKEALLKIDDAVQPLAPVELPLDEVTGCTHDPIPGCAGPAVPSTTAWGRLLLATLLVTASGILARTSRRSA